jgi:hypothetical protein
MLRLHDARILSTSTRWIHKVFLFHLFETITISLALYQSRMADQKTTPDTYITNKTTVPNNKMLLPCHIRFWLVKKFVKALNHTSDALQHACSTSLQMSEKNEGWHIH